MIEMKSVLDAIESSGVVSDMSAFDQAKTFKENGIDSLDVMSIFLAIEEHFGVKFSEEESVTLNSAVGICDAINQR